MHESPYRCPTFGVLVSGETQMPIIYNAPIRQDRPRWAGGGWNHPPPPHRESLCISLTNNRFILIQWTCMSACDNTFPQDPPYNPTRTSLPCRLFGGYHRENKTPLGQGLRLKYPPAASTLFGPQPTAAAPPGRGSVLSHPCDSWGPLGCSG